MKKFIYITDAHYGANPITRKDNYSESILAKLEYCLKLGQKHEAIIIHGGDLFDTPKTSITDLLKIFELFARYKDVKFITICGNESHDGHLDNSPLALLKKSNLIQVSSDMDYMDIEDVRLIFANNNDNPMGKEKFISPDKFNILMTHCILVKEPVVYDHILIEDFQTNADVVTIADYHPYQGAIEREDGVVFLAPGSLSRRKRTSHNIDRIPKGFFFNSSGNFKEFKIPCKMDIWVTKNVERENIFDGIREEVEKMRDEIDLETKSMSLESALEMYFKQSKAPQLIFDFIKERLAKI
jgi:predicted phosphodiesterase